MVAETIGAVVTSAAVAGTTKGATAALVRNFGNSFLAPLFEKYKAQQTLSDGVRRYLKRIEKSSRFIPTIAIQGSVFELDEVYEPLVLALQDGTEFEVSSYPKELLAKNSAILVIDSAGMGKSTLLKFILRRALAELETVPVLVELRRLKHNESLGEFVCAEMVGAAASAACKEKLRECFSSGAFLFLFDGYDEIDDELRGRVAAEISNFTNNYPDCGYLLTSRPDSALASFAGFAPYHLKPLTQQKAFSLLRKYDRGRGKADSLIAKIGQIAQIEEFLGNPLLVTLLYKAFDYKATIPLKRNIFFRQVYDALYQDHDLSKEGAYERRKKSALDIEDFHSALRALGVQTFTLGRVQYTAEQFTDRLGAAAALVKNLKIDIGKWRADLLSAVPIFVKEGTDIRWVHKAFQEYFTAQFVVNDLGHRKGEFVRRVFGGEGVQRHENLLRLISEIDIDTVRIELVAPFFKELRAKFAQVGGGSDVDFTIFVASNCAEYFLISDSCPDSRLKDGFSDFHPFFDALEERVGRSLEFVQASMTLFEGKRLCAVFNTSILWRRLGVLGSVDPSSFVSSEVLSSFDRKADDGALTPLISQGFLHLNEVIASCQNPKQRLAGARLMARALGQRIPSLTLLDRVLLSSSQQRDRSIEELIGSL